MYGQPSIDIGLNGRPYVVYVDYNGATSDVYYDFLIESTNPLNPLTMEANDPQKVDDGLPGEPAVNSGQPDIRVDRPIERNDNTVFTGTRNYFVHIIWTQEDEPGRYSLQYAKYHPLDANIDNPDVPEIIQRSLLPDGYALPVDIVDPELEITDNNYLTVIYAAMTRGYQEDPLDCHLFYTLVDNNGVVSTMNTIIFEATWVVRGAYNSASALNHEGELYCAWDQGDPTVQGGNFQNTIWQRDNSH